jgi:ParB/RepB/Spo0J family partition protein
MKTHHESKKASPAAGRKRGLAPNALFVNDARRAALETLERPSVPAAALVRAALEAPPPPTADRGGEAPSAARVLREVPLAHVAVENRRFQYRVARNLARLQESLLLQGQQVPVILRGKAPPYEIVAGFGRCDAIAALAGQGKLEDARVLADIRPDLSDREAHEISVLENEEREGLSDLDRINKARRLRDEGYQVSEIASVLKKGERMVQYYLSLSEAPRKISDALATGALRPTHALVLTKFARDALSELTPPEIESRLDELLERCAKGASVPELRALVVPRAMSRPLLIARGEGFELRGFSFSPTMEDEECELLLSVLDQARSRIAARLDRSSVGVARAAEADRRMPKLD